MIMDLDEDLDDDEDKDTIIYASDDDGTLESDHGSNDEYHFKPSWQLQWTKDFSSPKLDIENKQGRFICINGETPMDFFLAYYSEDVFDMITECTNIYGQMKYSKANKEWSKISKNEIKAFIGINILKASYQLPTYRHYWSTATNFGVKLVKETGRIHAALSVQQNQ